MLLQKIRKLVCLLSFCWIFFFNSIAYAKDVIKGVVKVATASNFLIPLKQLKYQFESGSNYVLFISSGSTAKLYAQILNGAPFDVFLSADQSTVNKLINGDKAVKASEFTYATGKLVLWGGKANRSPLSLQDDLLTKNFKHLAIANPKLAPYGRAAMEVLQSLNLDLKISNQLVVGENVGQAFQFVYSGNASMGLVALSQLKVFLDTGAYWEIPTNLYQPLRQSAVLLKRANNNAAAKAFLHFLKSPQVQQQITAKYGYLSDVSSKATAAITPERDDD